MNEITDEDMKLLTDLSNHPDWHKIAKVELGNLIKTVFIPVENRMIVIGERGQKEFLIDLVLANIKGHIQ